MKLVFMGTPDFAVGCLDSLASAGHDIAAVFTQPDKPRGRGYELAPPAVKVKAEELSIPVYQPKTLKNNEQALALLKEISPDCVVVVAYGKIIPAEMLDIPRFGFVNVHASLLPKYRGASPIQWAIVNGERESGVTTMQIDEGLDTGDMLEVAKTPIGGDMTAGELHDVLAELGSKLIVSTLEKLSSGDIKPVPQGDEGSSYAPIITKEMARIDFTKSASEIHDMIRGFNPFPTAFTIVNGKRIKVFSSVVEEGRADCKCGEIVNSDGKLVICCKDGSLLRIVELQPEGKRRMTAAQMLLGNPIAVGSVLE